MLQTWWWGDSVGAMMRKYWKTRTAAGMAIAISVAITGCTDVRFERASQKRVARIDNLLGRIEKKEAKAPERLAHTQRVAIAAIDRHRDWFQRDLALVDSAQKREVNRWPGRWARTVEFSRNYIDGDLASANATIPRLAY